MHGNCCAHSDGGEYRSVMVRSDEDLTLDGVESELAHGGVRIIADRYRCGENLRESNESKEQIYGAEYGESHLV